MILVLGAGGTVGRHLCNELETRGVEYRAAYRDAAKLEAALAEDIDAVEVDLARPQTIKAAMAAKSRARLSASTTL